MESLTLQGCEQISDEGFTALLRGCPNITALNLRGVVYLTEVILKQCAQSYREQG